MIVCVVSEFQDPRFAIFLQEMSKDPKNTMLKYKVGPMYRCERSLYGFWMGPLVSSEFGVCSLRGVSKRRVCDLCVTASCVCVRFVRALCLACDAY